MIEYTITSPTHSMMSEENDSGVANTTKEEMTILNNTSSFPKSQIVQLKTSTTDRHSPSIPFVAGRKTFAFWTLVFLLFLLAIGNLILTVTIVGVLKLGYGMESIELLPNDNSMKLFGNVDLDLIYKHNGKYNGYANENMEITGDDGSIIFDLYRTRLARKFAIDKNETRMDGFNSFTITNKHDENIFNLNNPIFKKLKNTHNFKSETIETNTIRSSIDENLKIESDIVELKGAEGAKIEARELVWSADQDIYLESYNGSIILSGKEGIYIDVKRIPIAKLEEKYDSVQFKICVCMPQGKLFRLPVLDAKDPVYCNQIDMSPQYNPCI